MHRRLPIRVIVVLLAYTSFYPVARAQEANSVESAAPVVDLAARQGQLSDKYKRLEALMLKMAEYDATNNPRRAALLRQALENSKERLVAFQLDSLVDLFQQEQLQRAADDQQKVQLDLKSLLDLLLSENRADHLQNEQARVRGYIKELDRIIRMQRAVQGRTEGGDDATQLSEAQKNITDRASQLGEKIDETEKTQGSSSDEAPSSDDGSEPSDAQAPDVSPADGANGGESQEGSEKSGEPGEGSAGKSESDDGDQGKSGDDQKSQVQDADKDDNPDKQNGKDDSSDDESQEPSETGGSKESGSKPSDSQKQSPSDGSPSDSGEPSESSGEPSPGKPSQGKPSSGKPSQGQPSQGQPSSEGESSDTSEQPPAGQQPDFPGRQRIAAAEEKMRQAEQRLTEAKRKEAVQEQEEARRLLELAKAELEEILRQMREEEVERALAMLEGRFRKMLEMQLRVYDDTLRLNKIPAAKRSRQFTIQCGKLGQEESKIVLEVDKSLALLKEEGSSVAFPEAVSQMRIDMQNVARRLSEEQVGRLTQGVEEDIIAALEEIVAALQKAQQDAEQRRNQPPPPGESSGDPEDQPLVDAIAELKMIRALQMRVNRRTQTYAEMLENIDDPIGQADDQEMIESLRDLAGRERRIQEVTRDIVLGKNK